VIGRARQSPARRFLKIFGKRWKNWFWKGCKPNSVCPEFLRGRESFVCAADTRNPFRFRETWSGPLRDSLFGLAPDGVFRAASLALRAVRSYRTFSPLPPACAVGGLIFCGTVRRTPAKRRGPPACIHTGGHGPPLQLRGIAPFGVRTFLSRLAPEAVLRPSKTNDTLTEICLDDKPGNDRAVSQFAVASSLWLE